MLPGERCSPVFSVSSLRSIETTTPLPPLPPPSRTNTHPLSRAQTSGVYTSSLNSIVAYRVHGAVLEGVVPLSPARPKKRFPSNGRLYSYE